MFFKHQDMQEDVKIRPDWKSFVGVGETKAGCPFSKYQSSANLFYEAAKETVGNLKLLW